MRAPNPKVTATATSSFPSLTLLTITFVVLKALGYITWSWIWVFSPLWIPWVLIAVVGLVFLIAWAGATLLDNHDKRKRRKKQEELREKQGIKARP